MTHESSGNSGAEGSEADRISHRIGSQPDTLPAAAVARPAAETPPAYGSTSPHTASPAMEADALLYGSQMAQVAQYELLGEIARGGMGVVYKARDRKLNRLVALKVIRAGQLASPSEAQRFQAEAEVAAKLDHPHIVPIYEVGEVDGLHFISMAFVEGQSLSERVASGPLPPRDAAALLLRVADAVSSAHSHGVIHRDLKPSNIMLDAAGQPRVTDFGLAKRTDANSSLTQVGQVMGTPSYMPPEQAEGKNELVGPPADVYSLGATLYCLVTGRPPFQSASPVETLKQVVEREPVAPHFLNTAVDRDLDTICLKCLQKQPERRYPSAAAVAEDLQRYLDRRPILARPVGTGEILVRWCRRNPLATTSLVSIVGVFVTAFVLVSWSYVRAEQRQKAERWERYRATMIAAGGAMQLHNATAAQSALYAAPEEYRSWEWKYFHHQLDTSQEVIRFGENIALVRVSPDCSIAAVQPGAGPARLWDLTTRQEFATLANSSPAPWFEFSPDSKTLACPAADLKSIRIWDIAASQERVVLSGFEKPAHKVHFSPNGIRLVAACDDGTVRVWDTGTGIPMVVLRHAQVSDATFNPDGRRIVSAGGDERTARIWDAETGQSLASLDGSASIGHAIFNPQGDLVLTGEAYPSNLLRLWDAGTGESKPVMRGHTNGVEAVAFSPDGTRIASGGIDRNVHLWDGRTGQGLADRDGHRDRITQVVFSPDGKYMLSASNDRTARLWDADDGTPRGVLHGHSGAITEAQYTADGTAIVTVSADDGTVRFWDARLAERGGALRGHESFVYDVAFHPDGERIDSAAWDGTVCIWDATTGRRISVLHYPYEALSNESIVQAVAFHPSGDMIATSGRDGLVRIWDLATEQELFHFGPSGGTRFGFNSRGDLLAAGGFGGTVHVWDVNRRSEYAALHGHEGLVYDVKFSPDSSWLASTGVDRTVRIWNVAKQQLIHTLDGHTNVVFALSISRDGKWLASGSSDGTVRLWDTSTWKEKEILRQGSNVYGVAFSPDGTRLACACANNMIRFWDMRTFELVAELAGHSDYVHQIAFSSDGTRLVSGSGDSTVRIWDTLSAQQRISSKQPVGGQ